jgi:tol-pal system protein YbgF
MKRLALALLSSALALPLLAAEPQGAGLEQRVDLLERKLRAMSDLVLRMDALQREVQSLRGEVEVQNHAMDALKKRQRDLYMDVDQRLGQISTGRPVPPAAPAVPAPGPAPVQDRPAVQPDSGVQPEPSLTAVASVSAAPVPAGDPAMEEGEYKQAFAMLMQRRYTEAKSAFQDFLARYPGGIYADNAQYWLAEASYVTRDFDTARVDFQRVIDEYPESPKVADAMLKTSFIQYEKQQWSEARATLEALMQRYPNSTASRLADRRLERMRAEGH